MAAGAGDVRLQLGVTLDLAGFRAQLAQASKAASAQYYPVNLSINKQKLDRQLKDLGKEIRLKINDSQLEGLARRLETAKTSLALLANEKIAIGVSVKNGTTQKDAKSVVADIYRTIRSSALEDTGGKIRIPVSIKPSITKADVADFKRAVKESLGDISVNVKANVKGAASGSAPPQDFLNLMEYMRTQGMVGKTASGMEMRMREPGGVQPQRTLLDQIARAIFFMAGVDPAAIRAREAERKRLPSINWPATTPMATGVSTVSSRALPFGRPFERLPGSSFASQKRLVGDILSPSLKEALRGAANAFVDAVRTELNAAIRSVSVKDLGNTVRAALPPGRIAGLLPAGVGRNPSTYATGFLGRDGESQAEKFARREREARVRSALREADAMAGAGARIPSPYSYRYKSPRPLSAIVPYAAGGSLVPQPGGGGGGGGRGTGGGGGRPPGGGGGGGEFIRAFANMQLPGSGVIRELGSEFAFATKQVLLFGQAYKLLAFLQDFPSQVGAAVGQLQSFRNTLAAISPTAKEAAMSNEFILSIVDRYNIPLQSAREGFAKLYASMSPAGFKGEEIRGLFTGISQAAATFGMSADKVDRVNYAFAQMASKGQVMSEELKGQLGDVLPGAMAIFTEAAGFKGPEAISKFSKALEDGAYKGDAMKQLLLNVGVIMRKEFGAGAEGAALTFQGVINRLQNSMKLLYESFEPVAVGFLNSVVVPLTNGIKVVTDGFNTFFTGTQAKTAGGAALAKELAQLRPSLEGIGQNLRELVPAFQLFGNILLNVGKVLASIAGNPVTGFLLKIYANVLLVNTVFTMLGGKILLGLVASIGATVSKFIALNAQFIAVSRSATIANTQLAGTKVQMGLLAGAATAATGPVTALKAALVGLARFGLIAIAIEVAISGMSEIDRLKKSLDDIAGFSSKEYQKQVKGLSREEVNSRIIVNRRSQVQARKELAQFSGPLGAARGLITGRDEELRARLAMQQVQEAVLTGARLNPTQAQLAQRQAGGALGNIPIGGGNEKAAKAKADKAANEAKRLAEEIAKQAQAASDALFAEQQRLSVMQATNPVAKTFAEFASQELTIRRELNQALKEAKSEKEKQSITETARIKSAQNSLTLEQEMQRVRENALQPIKDLLASQREQLRYEKDVKDLMSEGMLPERARQVAEVRKLVRAQMETLDLSISQAETAITEREAREGSSEATKKLREELERLKTVRGGIAQAGGAAEAGVPREAAKGPMDLIKDAAGSAREELDKLTNWGFQVVEGAKAIGSAFGQAFKDIASGSMSAQEALANMMQSIADHFLDMAAQIIAQQITMMIYGIILKALGVMGGVGGGTGANYSGAFGSTPGTSFSDALKMPKLAANGAVWEGGFQAFANGGIVQGPTLGLVGEGKYNEAIVPLPDGRSIPVQMQGESIRDKMGGNYGSSPSSPILSMSFETTSINGVEYVSREQLEAAMMETRRAAVKEGSVRGASLAIDKLQQSPNTRRRIGMR
jgi:tape measure domain-containing protein